MTRVRFREGNRLFFGQDFRFFTGVPADVWFECAEQEKWFELKAPSYGGQPYGNGSLFLYKATVNKGTSNPAIVKPVDERPSIGSPKEPS